MSERSFSNPAVAAAFAAFPPDLRPRLMTVRALILDTAASLPSVGEIEEALRWGEPAYLTPHSRSGSTIRLGWNKKQPGRYAVYFNCQTTLVDTFHTLFPRDFIYEGNRAILLDAAIAVQPEPLAFCITAALTYHDNARAKRSESAGRLLKIPQFP